MHYKNGRPAKVGDKIINFSSGKPELLGLLIEATPGSTSCNGKLLPLPVTHAHYITIGDCLHVDDLTVAPTQAAQTP